MGHEDTSATPGPITVAVVGAGGNIGSHLVTHLARLPRVDEVLLVDPDVYQAENLVSQDIVEEDIVFIIEARSFLHHQVRIMIGTLVEIGRGEKPVEWARETLEKRVRANAGPTMPAQGLCLDFIGYPEELFPPE